MKNHRELPKLRIPSGVLNSSTSSASVKTLKGILTSALAGKVFCSSLLEAWTRRHG
jgi:hypothetical protein